MNTENNTVIFYITDSSLKIAERLNGLYPDAQILKFKSEIIPEIWNRSRSLIFIMATGIVVRTIAPLIKDKRTDPAVVVLDEKGRYAISLLSGHLGKANELTKNIAAFLKGEAVITTASDINNLPSIDMWAKDNDLVIENWDILPRIATKFLNSKKLNVYSDIEIQMPEEFHRTDKSKSNDIIITNKKNPFTASPLHPFTGLYLRPKNLIIGIGCNSSTPAVEIEDAIKTTLNENNLSFLSIHSIATIDIKGSEKGLREFAEKYNLKINTFTAQDLNSVKEIQRSDTVFKATGAFAVAEPAALLASGASKLLVPKHKRGNVTIAVAEIKGTPEFQTPRIPKLYIVGTGPGNIEHITPYARDAIRKSDVIVGYGTYLDLIQELIRDKKVVSTGMTQEIDRCKKAVEIALSGKTVSVISGGDPGIYAMAGLVFEILRAEEQKSRKSADKQITEELSHFRISALDIEVIPGISALNACAARLGAPLMHDFAVISLSDRLTPWELIEERLEAAAMSDFVIVLYNPKSTGRQGHIKRAREILLKYREPKTPVGMVRGAMREKEGIIITDLGDMLNYEIDMQTTVIIGNSRTYVWNNRMITPRGYEKKMDR